MMATRALTYEELAARLEEAEGIIAALRNQEVDAIVGEDRVAMVRLKEVEEALRQAKVELEQRVVERTAELARVNCRLREIIEEQERTQRQLERYADQLREQAELLDLAHDMIFVHDMEGRIIFWNHGAEVTYGWTREQALGQLSHRLLRTEYSEPLLRITARIIRDGWWEGELTHTARDGRQIPVASCWALRRGDDKRPVAILEIDNDITTRKQAEQQMAEARRFAENIVDTIQEGLVVLDSQLRVIAANRSFHATFGTTRTQVEGQFFLTLDAERWNIPALRDRFRDVLTLGSSFEGFEVECVCPAGEAKTLVLSARPFPEKAFGSGMILLVVQDVTLRKRQEGEIQADKQQLALLTEELMRIEERQRRQIAQALHDSVGEPLAVIQQEIEGFCQSPTQSLASLQQVCEQVGRAIEWTRNLTLELSPSTLYTQGLAAALRELAEQFTDCGGFVCRVQVPEGPIPVLDQVRTMLYRAVRELLVNVVKHAQASTVEITLDCEEQNVRITVQDDGKGFDPSILEARRADGSFGIYSIRERLTRIGGKFAVDSVEGRGTRVTLIAPLDLGYQ